MLLAIIIAIAFAGVIAYFSTHITPDTFTLRFAGHRLRLNINVIVWGAIFITSVVVSLVAAWNQRRLTSKLRRYEDEIRGHEASDKENKTKIAQQEKEIRELRKKIKSLEAATGEVKPEEKPEERLPEIVEQEI